MKTKEDSEAINTAATTPSTLNKCSGSICCSTCFWLDHQGGYCSGCDSLYQQRCIKQICDFNCFTCSGGRHAHVVGCCGRSPASWREKWRELLAYPVPHYTPEPLHIKCQLIPIIHSVRKYRIPEQFPQIDAWAVPIHKVANQKGEFYSDDLKDYLGLPLGRKLILSTSAPDDYQEMLWERGPQIDYRRYGIDYWFPAHFSIYDDDSKLYQFASAKRQQLHVISTSSQFVWFRLGEHIPIEFLSAIRSAPSVLISTGQMYSKHNQDILRKEVQIADEWFPAGTSFFVVGGRHHFSVSIQRRCYELNSQWLMRGLKGYNLARLKDRDIPREKVLINNLKEVLENVHSTTT